MDISKFDSIIFDMDGTLWDAVDSYCQIWDKTIAECGIKRQPVTRIDLISLMGKTLDAILDKLMPENANDSHFLQHLDQNERLMMPILGGHLYSGVKSLIPLLAEHYKLFMVSNCSSHGLPIFLEYTGLKPYFIDMLSHGDNNCDKTENIRLIIDKHALKSPLYVGDTIGDEQSSRKAGIAFAWASYGFGDVKKPDFTLNEFSDLQAILL